MPIFDYSCKNCGYEFEFLKVFTYEEPLCPVCGSEDVKKIVSLFHVSDQGRDVLRNLPDPRPPLTEFADKASDLPARSLNEYKRVKLKDGRTMWLPKEKKIFH